MSGVSYYTAEGLKKLREELDYLKSVMRPKASQDIADARDKGDLSENAEYDAAKEAQGMLEMRIAKLEEVHSNARLIDETHLDLSKVLVLSNVKIKNQTNGMEMTYTLVAESEADLKTGKISVTSPIGKGLLGKSVGEVAEINVPNGVLKFEMALAKKVFSVLLKHEAERKSNKGREGRTKIINKKASLNLNGNCIHSILLLIDLILRYFRLKHFVVAWILKFARALRALRL